MVAIAAEIEVMRRKNSTTPLPTTRINLPGPDTLTGQGAAAIWFDALGREIDYPCEDVDGFEQNLRQFMPSWMALDMRLIAQRLSRTA